MNRPTADQEDQDAVALEAPSNFVERHGWLTWTIPAALTMLVCGYKATTAALWTDELATWSAARRPISELFALLGNVDAALGAYYVFMHGWISVFGDSELSLRVPSMLAMAGSAACLAAMGRRIYDTKVGVTVGVLFALVPAVTRFGQEARVYALVLVLVIASTYMLLLALDQPSWQRWCGYGALVALLGLAHTVALLILASHALEVGRRAWAIRAPGGARRYAMRWIAATGGGLVVAAPAVWWGFSQREQVAWNAKPRLLALAELPGEVFGTPIVGGFVLGIALWAVLSNRVGWSMPMLVSWALVGPCVLFIAGRFTPVWNPRYVLFVMPAVLLLATAALAELSWRRLGIAALAMALIVAAQQQALRKPDAHARMDGRAVAELITPRFRDGDAFAYVKAEVWAGRDTVRYYVGPAVGKPTPDAFAVKTPEQADELIVEDCLSLAQCQKISADAKRVWLIRWGTYSEALSGVEKPKAEVLRSDYRVDQQWQLSNMTVVLFERR